MKLLVGKRESVPNPELRGVKALLDLFCTGQTPSAKVIYPGKCKKCSTPVDTIFTEDISTHEIWVENPDNCPKCGHELVAKDLPKTQLSQAAIIQIFGQVIA